MQAICDNFYFCWLCIREQAGKLTSEGLGFVRWRGTIRFKSGAYTKYVSILNRLVMHL